MFEKLEKLSKEFSDQSSSEVSGLLKELLREKMLAREAQAENEFLQGILDGPEDYLEQQIA